VLPGRDESRSAARAGLREACGLFGIIAPQDGDYARYAYFGLYALQHRGQEAAGIVAGDADGRLRVCKREGLVAQAIRAPDLATLDPCRAVIGHTRYGTSGADDDAENGQPIVAKLVSGYLALAHNGTLVNAPAVVRELEARGAIFRSSMDSEVFVHLLARANARPFEQALHDACSQVQGAYCLLMLHRGRLYAVRDPYGFRPLFVGRLRDAQVVASETCAFDLIGAVAERELAPGELAVLGPAGYEVRQFLQPALPPAPCIFELIYFARPDSTVFGRSVYDFRVRLGEELAEEAAGEIRDAVVVPVPDSGVPAAMGYARRANLPFELGLIRSHYVGRTFIQPFQEIRDLRLKIKLNGVRSALRERDVVLVDDSLVRGTTCRWIVDLVRDRGARRVHVAIASPPITWPCYFGVDTPNKDKLVAGAMSVPAIREFLGADTLRYLSLEGLTKVFGERNFCTGCFTGEYPIPVDAAGSRREG
jgi:amidophosphoribosyltransferase